MSNIKKTIRFTVIGTGSEYTGGIIDNDSLKEKIKEKIGKYTPGTHIPIVSIDYFRKNYPNVLLLCSWNHKKEILSKEKKFLKVGGKWISHVKKI